MSILGFLIVGNPKMTFIFILKDLQPPQGRPQGGAGGLQGVLSPILPNIMCYVNSGVFNCGKSKNDLHFHFRAPQSRPQGGGLGGLEGVLSPILPNIMCYVNSEVLNSGKSKNYPYFHFWVPQLPQGRP